MRDLDELDRLGRESWNGHAEARAFIEAAREDWGEMVAELRRLRKENAILQSDCARSDAQAEELVRVIERLGKWQPISTAPKDGTPILIYDPTKPDHNTSIHDQRYDNPRYAIGYYRIWQDGGEWMWGDRNHTECSPTHWMPLPSPPLPNPPGEA